jgi:DNA-binding response OmpR family regulator
MSQTSLIVAHDPWFIQLLRIYAEEIGLRVTQAYDGQDVLPMVHRDLPAVILLEEDLPGKVKSGELLRDLRADSIAGRLPILVFSWQGEEYNKEMLQLQDAAVRLQAPITFESFVDALKSAGVELPAEKRPQRLGNGQEADGKDNLPDLKSSKRRTNNSE